jgi:hypothetical protein
VSGSAICKRSTSVVAVLIALAVPVASASAGYKVGGQGLLPVMRIDQACRDGVRFMAATVPPDSADPLSPRTYLEHVQVVYDDSGSTVALTDDRRLWIPYREVVVPPEPQIVTGGRPLTLTHSGDFKLRFDRVLDSSVATVTLNHQQRGFSRYFFDLDVSDCMLVDLEPRARYPNTLSPRMSGARVDFALLSTPVFRAGRLDLSSMRTATGEVQTLDLQNAIGGAFTLSFRGATTSPISYWATPADVQYALSYLPTIGWGNVSVSRFGPFYISFTGSLAGTDVELLQADTAGLGPAGPPPAPQPSATIAAESPVRTATALSMRKTDVDGDGIRDAVGRFAVADVMGCAPSLGVLGVRLTTTTDDGRSYVGVDEAQTVC